MTTSKGWRLSVSGIVQGVGFRPFIWRLANQENLCGCVYNDAGGVKVELLTDIAGAERFSVRIQQEAPPLSIVDSITIEPMELTTPSAFNIITSRSGEVTTGCAPDAATCPECLAEFDDIADRRYQYPFTNCTNCGPRLSIIRGIPYDRATTTMAGFTLCQSCQNEYDDPANRRFHAQPNACPECGPHCFLETPDGKKIESSDPFKRLAEYILRGDIIAIKGIGGVHLACDATNEIAVKTLRERKQRPHKALALMAKDVESVARYAEVDSAASALLTSQAAPVVVLPRLNHCAIAASVAPDTTKLGFMLPYSPVHWLLLRLLDVPLVMTSGNRSGEPQAITNEDARAQLTGIADIMLLHNRPIQNRLDDSVVLVGQSGTQVLRRARGYAPTSLPLPAGFQPTGAVIALGGQLKSTICLVKNNRAIVTQHLGDLHDVSTFDQYLHTLALYSSLYAVQGAGYVCDMHPEYQSTKYAVSLAEQGHVLTSVQHHHAHIASCLGDNNYPMNGADVLGICLDGTGYGADHTLWGGEFLYGNYTRMARLASIAPFPLIGGAQAIKSPWRSLYAQLRQCYSAAQCDELSELFPSLASPMCRTFEQMLNKQLNCPMTSSAGRLFDAVAVALGCSAETITYEGQAAIQLEALATRCTDNVAPYPFELNGSHIVPAPMWAALIADIKSQRSKPAMALAFHLGLVKALTTMTLTLKQSYDFSTVAVSGGVMQNLLILEPLIQALTRAGFKVLRHHKMPANDGGIAFGQALVALAQTS